MIICWHRNTNGVTQHKLKRVSWADPVQTCSDLDSTDTEDTTSGEEEISRSFNNIMYLQQNKHQETGHRIISPILSTFLRKEKNLVNNLPSRPLNPTQLKVLNFELGYAPTPINDSFQMHIDLFKLIRQLKLRAF